MKGVNKAIIIGNLGQDPELKTTQTGKTMALLNVATTESWKTQSGEYQDKTEWHRVLMFNRLAELAGEYLKKGSSIYIEGKISYRKWQDDNGQTRYSTEIMADQMQFIGSRSDNASGSSQAVSNPVSPDPNEDVPF